MKARGIIYSAPMIRAKLKGRKTMTRRMNGLDNINKSASDWLYDNMHDGLHSFEVKGTFGDCEVGLRCPYGQVGDILYSKETHSEEIVPVLAYDDAEDIEYYHIYRADKECEYGIEIGKDATGFKAYRNVKWTSSLLMPQRAARFIDQIVSIKAERVQDISAEDVLNEGVGTTFRSGARSMTSVNIDLKAWESRQKDLFETLWTSINGKESWNTNPWVWVIETKNLSTTGWKGVDKSILSQIENLKAYTEDTILDPSKYDECTFGRYAGKAIKDVPPSFFLRMVEQGMKPGYLREYIKDNLGELRKKAKALQQ